MIVFGVLSANGKIKSTSVYHGDDAPLDYTIGIGVFAFLTALVFLFLELSNDMTAQLQVTHAGSPAHRH